MTKEKIKVLSYNIHKGFTIGNRKLVIEHIREAIRSVDADLVFLQEVVGHNTSPKHKINNWPNTAQFEYLADSVWSHYAYGKNAAFIDRNHGNAILSKYPIVDWENVNISTNALEKRGILHTTIEIPEKEIQLHAFCVHLDLTEGGRNRQIEVLTQRISEHVQSGEPVIIGGDFNDWRKIATNSLKKALGLDEVFLKHFGAHAKTFPCWFPALRLDRIYFRGLDVISAACLNGKPWTSLSDHAALTCELMIL